MAKKSNSNPPQNNSVVFVEGSMWIPSVVSAQKDTPNILQKIQEFMRFKEANPLAQYGTNDKPFTGNGIYKQYLQKAVKAHLTPDIAIVYELSGRNPTTIKLYGVFTHADLGTGQPPNIKIQKNMAKRLSVSENDHHIPRSS